MWKAVGFLVNSVVFAICLAGAYNLSQQWWSVVTYTTPHMASSGDMVATSTKTANHGRFMLATGQTGQPIGHYNYCQVYTDDCQISSTDNRPVYLTQSRWHELVKVNNTINQKIQPVTDIDLYGVEEFWTYPKAHGDCEDYALLKRYMLRQRGWPASSLLLTVVKQPNDEAHAILTVRTSNGDFILDNLENSIQSWNETEYRFIKRQSPYHAGKWEKIEDNRIVAPPEVM